MIISPFNLTFCLMACLFILFDLCLSLAVRGKNLCTRRTVIAVLYLCALVYFYFYKLSISKDPTYYELAGYGTFTWWNELPLQLCNIILITTPIAALTMSTPLLAFSFYCSFVGPLAALIMPGVGFDGYSILLPRVMGYYITHFIALSAGPLLAATGLYRPKLKDVLPSAGLLFLLSLLIFIVNYVLRRTGLDPAANYFFTMDPEGNALLETFRRFLPLPYLFVLPALLLIIPIFALVGVCFEHGRFFRDPPTRH